MIRKMISDDLLFVLIFMYPEGRSCPIIKYTNDVWAVEYLTKPNPGGTQTLIEHWDGSQWTMVSSPNPGSVRDELYGVAAISANDVWAVGDSFNGGNSNNLTLIEHWDGTSWS